MNTIDFKKRAKQRKSAKEKAEFVNRRVLKLSGNCPQIKDFIAQSQSELEDVFFQSEILQEKLEDKDD